MKTLGAIRRADAIQYTAAGWLAILQAIVLLPEIGLAVYLDLLSHSNAVLK